MNQNIYLEIKKKMLSSDIFDQCQQLMFFISRSFNLTVHCSERVILVNSPAKWNHWAVYPSRLGRRVVEDREMKTASSVISSRLVEIKITCSFAAGSRDGYFVLVLYNGQGRNNIFVRQKQASYCNY